MRQTPFVAGLLLFGGTLFGADQQLMNMLMPDAKVVAGINVTQAQTSPFGQYMLSQMAKNGTGFQDFITSTGFDPRRDVTEILIAANADPQNPRGLVLARGQFNVDQLTAAMTTARGSQKDTYAGATLIASTGEKRAHAVAFIESTIALTGDLASVKDALDRRNATNSIDTSLAAKVNHLSTSEDAWSANIASLNSFFTHGVGVSGDNPAAQTLMLFKNVQSSSGGVKFGDTVQITAEAVTDDPKNASALGDVIKFLASIVAANAGKDAHSAAVGQILKNLSVTTSGTAVNVALTIPETDLESLIQTAQAARPPRRTNQNSYRRM